ncbi:unnamed protein product, partial [Mycena citricolor]
MEISLVDCCNLGRLHDHRLWGRSPTPLSCRTTPDFTRSSAANSCLSHLVICTSAVIIPRRLSAALDQFCHDLGPKPVGKEADNRKDSWMDLGSELEALGSLVYHVVPVLNFFVEFSLLVQS